MPATQIGHAGLVDQGADEVHVEGLTDYSRQAVVLDLYGEVGYLWSLEIVGIGAGVEESAEDVGAVEESVDVGSDDGEVGGCGAVGPGLW